jgi:hypothetical protein
MRKKFLTLLVFLMAFSLMIPVFADNFVADGDGLTPVERNSLNLGTITAGSGKTGAVLLAISRHGSETGTNTFKNGTSISISFLSSDDAYLNVSMSDSNISTPSTWTTAGNGTITSDTAYSTVTLSTTASVGTHRATLTYRATGLNVDGNSINRDATVIVDYSISAPADSTAPVLTLPENMTIEATSPDGAVVTYLPTAIDGVDGARIVTCNPESGSTFALGTTTVYCSASDTSGNTATGSFTVTIVDTTVPVFTALPSAKTVEATAVNTPKADVDFGTVTAFDIFGATLTNDAPATFPMGTTTVTWTATDGNGLTSTAEQMITIVDTTVPVFTFVPATKQIKATAINTPVTTAELGTAIATDIFGVTVTNNAPATFPIGKTTVTWTATDGNGLTSTSTQDVIVTYNFTGFFQPVDMNGVVNTVKAGSAIPIKFSLHGNMGLNIFAAEYPSIVTADFSTSQISADIETILTAGNSNLSYDPIADQYIYVWKTDRAWTGLGKQLTIKLIDGTYCTANFKFK